MSNQVSYGASSQVFNHELRAPVPRSVFDLSYIHSFSADFGQLIPFCIYDTLPNDDFKLSNIVRVSTLPMVSPVYNAIKIKTWWFYTPYYLLWRHFDRFISGGRDGTYSVIPPIVGDSSSGVRFSRGSLADFFNLPVDVQIPADDCPLAFPFMAYQRIYRDYFMNQDVQTESNINNWFPDDDSKFQLSDGFQVSVAPEGVSDDDPAVDITAMRYKNWEKDYFTSAMFEPQRGPATALPVNLDGSAPASGYPFVSEDLEPRVYWKQKSSEIPFASLTGEGMYFSSEFDLDNARTYLVNGGFFGSPTATSARGIFGFAKNADGHVYPYAQWTDIKTGTDVSGGLHVEVPSQNPSKAEFDNYLHMYLSSSSGGFLIDDLRLATQLQLWLERNMRTKAQYQEFLRIHFNDAPLDMRLTKPYYIGGSSQMLTVTQVLQTSQSTDDSELGQRAGTGNSYGAFDIGRFHSHEYGLIMGIMAIMPDAMYTQGINRLWTRRSRYDFYFPEFAQLSPQAILSRELFVSPSPEINRSVFGYQGRFDEYRTANNVVTGLLRDSSKLDFYTYTLAREFDTTPTLSPQFISSEGTIRHDAFVSGTSLPPFICQVGIGCRAVRPLPYVNQPMGLL